MSCELCGVPEACSLNLLPDNKQLKNERITDSLSDKVSRFKTPEVFTQRINNYEMNIVLAMSVCSYFKALQERRGVRMNNEQIEAVKSITPKAS